MTKMKKKKVVFGLIALIVALGSKAIDAANPLPLFPKAIEIGYGLVKLQYTSSSIVNCHAILGKLTPDHQVVIGIDYLSCNWSYVWSYKYKDLAVSLSDRYYPNISSSFIPYFGVGLTIHFTKLTGQYLTSQFVLRDIREGAKLSYNVFMGGRLALRPRLALFIEGKFTPAKSFEHLSISTGLALSFSSLL